MKILKITDQTWGIFLNSDFFCYKKSKQAMNFLENTIWSFRAQTEQMCQQKKRKEKESSQEIKKEKMHFAQ